MCSRYDCLRTRDGLAHSDGHRDEETSEEDREYDHVDEQRHLPALAFLGVHGGIAGTLRRRCGRYDVDPARLQ
jgi:hypothetical protein